MHLSNWGTPSHDYIDLNFLLPPKSISRSSVKFVTKLYSDNITMTDVGTVIHSLDIRKEENILALCTSTAVRTSDALQPRSHKNINQSIADAGIFSTWLLILTGWVF